MTTLSFQIDSSEVEKIKAVLKALGGTKIKIESDDEFSELNDRVREVSISVILGQ